MTDLVKEVKLTELDNKTPDVSGLVTKLALTAVENKINEASNLVKKTDYNTKISEIETKRTDHNHDKYITNAEFNEVTTENFAGRLKQANLATKDDTAESIKKKKTDFDDKLKNLKKIVTQNKTKNIETEKKLTDLKLTDLTNKFHEFQKKDIIFC